MPDWNRSEMTVVEPITEALRDLPDWMRYKVWRYEDSWGTEEPEFDGPVAYCTVAYHEAMTGEIQARWVAAAKLAVDEILTAARTIFDPDIEQMVEFRLQVEQSLSVEEVERGERGS